MLQHAAVYLIYVSIHAKKILSVCSFAVKLLQQAHKNQDIIKHIKSTWLTLSVQCIKNHHNHHLSTSPWKSVRLCFCSFLTLIGSFTFLLSALSLFLVAACLCLTEGRSHHNTKITALIKKLEEARDSRRFNGRVQVADDGDDCPGGSDYYCDQTDFCCDKTVTGDDPAWVCCTTKQIVYIGFGCAETEDNCNGLP